MIITRIWRTYCPGATYFCLSTKDANGIWKDHFFKKSQLKNVKGFIKDNRDKDLYFCPHGFDAPRRQKPHAVMPKLLWSDMDEADPRAMKIKPSIAIESSPGRHVGLWLLDSTMEESLNRRLTYFLGADKSGWDLTQVLRIPGTINYKYASHPRARIMWSDGEQWARDVVDKKLPKDQSVDIGSTTDAAEAYKKWCKKLRWSTRRELTTRKTPPVGKRNEVLHRLFCEMVEAGVTMEDGIVMLKACVWNKFAGRRNEDEQLQREWDKALNKRFQANRPVAGEEDGDDYEFLSKPISEVEERDLDWVWYPYLARGEVTILQGDPEAGKSFIAQNVSGYLAGGKALPCHVDDMPKVCGKVAYFDLENTAETVTKKRLRWNGFEEHMENFYQEERPFSIDDEDALERVYAALERVKPTLIVFDTMNTYIGRADTNNGSQSQQSFVKFKDMATRFNCSVLVLRHLTKGSRDRAMYRGQGSIAFTGICRVEITAGQHPEDEGVRVMARSKGNLTQKPPALTYEILDRGDRKERDRSRFKWGDFINMDAEDIVQLHKKPESNERDDAKKFLKDELGDGPVSWDKLVKMAEARSFSERTLRRASDELNVIRKTSGFGESKKTMCSLRTVH